MIFYSFNQLNNVLIFLFCGIILGFIYNTVEIIFLINYQKKIKYIVFNSIFYVFFALFFIFLINIFNFGLLSFSLLASIILGFLWFKAVSKKLVVFLKNKCYTLFNKNSKGTKCKTKKKLKH